MFIRLDAIKNSQQKVGTLILNARNPSEALELAEKLRSTGKFDLFRGQSQNWPVESTFNRKEGGDRATKLERFNAFYGWAKSTPGMQPYTQNDDSILAVAQHYGLATPLVDFTTDPSVAMAFAVQNKTTTEDAVIVLVNSKELGKFIEESKFIRNIDKIKVLRPTVPNLWRLEAQKGVFIDLPVVNFESWFPFARIVFPALELPAPEQSPTLYPKRKSDLERLIDRYFMEERVKRGGLFAANLPTFSKMRTVELIEPDVQDGINKARISSSLSQHHSWAGAKTARWRPDQIPHEQYRDAPSAPFVIALESKTIGVATFNYLVSTLLKNLESGALNRDDLTSFKVEVPSDCSNAFREDKMVEGLSRIWDGMRRLPFPNLAISRALVRYLQIATHHGRMSDVYDQPLAIEFGTKLSGSYSRAFISSELPVDLVRDDIMSFIRADYKTSLSQNLKGLIDSIRSPNKLFEFSCFVDFIADQVIPSQEFERGPSGLAQFYSPLDYEIFGLA